VRGAFRIAAICPVWIGHIVVRIRPEQHIDFAIDLSDILFLQAHLMMLVPALSPKGNAIDDR
jgi:sporulation-control protein spo0M